MARPLRITYPGAVYHITGRGNEKKTVFKDEPDYNTFLKTLHQVNKRYNWICHAYCLMGNHYHLLIETPDGNISIGMRQLNGVYTQAYNKRHKRVGHLFQGRYKAIVLQKDSHLFEACRYIVLNPVRAGMVERPEQWNWSSYRATAGKGKTRSCLTVDWILSQFNSKKVFAEKEYRKFIREGISRGSIFKEVKAQIVLGDEDFVDNLRDYIRGYRDIADIPKSQRYVDRPGLKEVFKPHVLKNKKARNQQIVEAVESYGYTQREVSDHLGMYFTSISRIMRETNK